jgi:hypothetical protein
MHSTLKNFFNENVKNSSFNNFNNYFFDINQNTDSYLLNITNIANRGFEALDNKFSSDSSLVKNVNNFMRLDDKSFDNKMYEYLFSKFPETQTLTLSKLFIPKPFNVSPSNVYNGLP